MGRRRTSSEKKKKKKSICITVETALLDNASHTHIYTSNFIPLSSTYADEATE